MSEFRRPLLEMLAHLKNIDVDVFDDVLQNTKHRANDASNDVNRPPLVTGPLKGKLKIQITNKHGGKTS